jgi:hypothetical protein
MKNKKFIGLIPLGLLAYLLLPTQPHSEPLPASSMRAPAAEASRISPIKLKAAEKTQKHKDGFTFEEQNRQASIAVFKKMQRYPSTTQPIAKGSKVDPIAQRVSPKTTRQLGESEVYFEVETTLEKNVITSLDKTLQFELKTFKKGQVTSAQKVTLINNERMVPLTPTSEGVYQHELLVSDWKEGEHRLELVAQFAGEEIRSEILIQKDTLIAHHKHSHRPKISSEGDLLITNDFEFLVAGDVVVEAVLYSSTGELIGKAHQVLTVTPGLKPVELSFYGLLLHEAKISGSVEVRHIQLTLVDEELATKALQVSQLQQTSPSFQWEQFRSTPFDNQVIAEKLARLESKL